VKDTRRRQDQESGKRTKIKVKTNQGEAKLQKIIAYLEGMGCEVQQNGRLQVERAGVSPSQRARGLQEPLTPEKKAYADHWKTRYMSEHQSPDHSAGRSHLLTAREISQKKQEWFAASSKECTDFSSKQLKKLVKPDLGKIPRSKRAH